MKNIWTNLDSKPLNITYGSININNCFLYSTYKTFTVDRLYILTWRYKEQPGGVDVNINMALIGSLS